ncbi:MAG: prepilin-type N-terminal cleavage/methylation domain-containing protein [Uliginosibacterium sp.]|nr:prepilin-type N-terminal cleavage/methylation domain-containing protein [Uliginosibacterium sp.]MBK9616884.1 prepilin-type N-terminal cleavage/methylation domain-containing protein [Uliginosibacterium sp.]
MSQQAPNRGFTLIEMLVALMLLSMVMLGLSAALRGFAQTESRIDNRIVRGETIRTLDGFLREIMGWVSSSRLPGQEGKKPRVALIGGQNELAWMGGMPARHGVGGLFYLRLGVERRENGPAMVLRYLPLRGKPEAMPDWAAAEAIDLAEGVEGLQFQYLGEGEDGWLSEWSEADKLPSHIRLSVQGLGGAFPDLVVGVAEGSAETTAGGIVIGGGG